MTARPSIPEGYRSTPVVGEPDSTRNTLIRQQLKATARRFDENASVTGYGELGYECAQPVSTAISAARRILHNDRHSSERGRAARDLIERGGLNHHDFCIVLSALEDQIARVPKFDYSRVLDRLQEAGEQMDGVFREDAR